MRPALGERLLVPLRWVGTVLRNQLTREAWERHARAAGAVAGRAGRKRTTIDDLVIVCIGAPEAQRAIQTLGADPAKLAASINSALASVPGDTDLEGKVTGKSGTTTAWQRVLGSTVSYHHYVLPEIPALSLLLACLREPVCLSASVFAEAGIGARRLALFIGHGMLSEPSVAIPSSERAAVVVLNDPVSMSSDVCSTLQAVLGVAHEVSHPLMQAVHKTGRAVVFEGATQEAVRLCSQLNAEAVRRAMALVATVDER